MKVRAAAQPRAIRFVLSDVAVRRIRAADVVMTALFARLYREAPAWLVNEVAEAHLSLTEACNELARCNVENAPEGATE